MLPFLAVNNVKKKLKMKKSPYARLNQAVMVSLALTVFISCGQAKKKPARKTLPELTDSFHGGRDQARMTADKNPFHIGDTTMVISGLRHQMLTIGLPNPEFDDVAMNIANAYAFEPLTNMLWERLLDDQKTGLIVNFIQNNGNQLQQLQQQSFTVENSDPQLKKLPVIFICDESSKARAAVFVARLGELSFIKLNSQHSVTECLPTN